MQRGAVPQQQQMPPHSGVVGLPFGVPTSVADATNAAQLLAMMGGQGGAAAEQRLMIGK